MIAAAPVARAACKWDCPRPPCALLRNVTDVDVEGTATIALNNTGAAVPVISKTLCCELKKLMESLSGLMLRTASNQRIAPSAVCTALITIQHALYMIEFFVLRSCSHDIILRWDFFLSYSATIDCFRAEVALMPLQALFPSILLTNLSLRTQIFPCRPNVCTTPLDGAALFALLEVFLHRRGLQLPFAVLSLESGASIMLIANSLMSAVTLLRGESVENLRGIDFLSSLDISEDEPYFQLNVMTSPVPTSLARHNLRPFYCRRPTTIVLQ